MESGARQYQVHLNPCFFMDAADVTLCHRRNGGTWQNAEWNSRIIIPQVFFWLRENIGYATYECWDCDRYYYPGEPLPELPTGMRAEWIAAGFKNVQPVEQRFSFTERTDDIVFQNHDDFISFRVRWGEMLRNYEFVASAIRLVSKNQKWRQIMFNLQGNDSEADELAAFSNLKRMLVSPASIKVLRDFGNHQRDVSCVAVGVDMPDGRPILAYAKDDYEETLMRIAAGKSLFFNMTDFFKKTGPFMAI